MAIVSKSELDKLWAKFQSNPNSLNINEYKTIADSARKANNDGLLSNSDAQAMMSAVSSYC